MYLSDYGSVITGIASRLKDPAHTESFIRFAGDSIVVERALHESFIHEIKEMDRLKPSPACLLYTSYLWRQLAVSIRVVCCRRVDRFGYTRQNCIY